jgi:hypothetical protein
MMWTLSCLLLLLLLLGNCNRAMLALENEMMALLDYGGISTNDAESAIKRASKGGMVAAKQLRGLVATLAGEVRVFMQGLQGLKR